SAAASLRWTRGKLIGKGSHGRVYVASTVRGDIMVVRQVEMPIDGAQDASRTSAIQALKREREFLEDLHHPNVIRYLGSEETPTMLNIFLEYVPGGSIASLLQNYGIFEEPLVMGFAKQILRGIQYLHSVLVIHCNLKASNILVDSTGTCKISDFASSKRFGDFQRERTASSLPDFAIFWMAPEVVRSGGRGYSYGADIWSFGCTVLEMYSGRPPWDGLGQHEVEVKLSGGETTPPLPTGIGLSPSARDFLLTCFAATPQERGSASVLLEHVYLS
ncbi:kinase-like protein, partial [Punctularia strigosozonata HHB-11173 SS5]|uniref:kinase-like protein n=1 Tax=Punctularia strigosozonata (strain HHB-11173) TaxID=741275 RepID=UPI0004416951